MHTDILTLKDLIQKEVRYTIPPFQRPYVWSQDRQWEPLWEPSDGDCTSRSSYGGLCGRSLRRRQ